MLSAPQLCTGSAGAACGSTCCPGAVGAALLATSSARGTRGEWQVAHASKVPSNIARSVQDAGETTTTLTGCFSLGCVAAAGVAAARRKHKGGCGKKSHERRNTGRFHRTTMNFFNPFQEDPEKKTMERLQPRVEEINALEETMEAKSNEELRAVTDSLRERCANGESLESLLPEAFAAVREASWRVLNLRHFDVQLMGGLALHEGSIAEMGTGEGKTLVAILPAYLNALTRKGVHIVTVNDYLAKRDAEWVGQPLRFLGVSVGVVQNGMPAPLKKKAYRCDVTYVTNSELGFDYLRDQMAASPESLVLREKDPFNFAIVDEVDSILIDEARTPLIISGQAPSVSNKYQVAHEVATALRRDIHYTVDEKNKQCILVEEGVDAASKLLGKEDLFAPEDPWFPFLAQGLNAKELYIRDKSYIVRKGQVLIVDEFTGRVLDGRRWKDGLHQAIEAKERVTVRPDSITLASVSYQSLFRLFKKLSGMTGTASTEAEEFTEVYKLPTTIIPANRTRNRTDNEDCAYADVFGKWRAVAEEIERFWRIGRPILVGTTSVESSEIVAELLENLEVPYKVLNAKPENVSKESEIVASSGRKYSVTIATNMAGRGTDILLGGNPSMMARFKLREVLFSRLFKKSESKWVMPKDFYPRRLSKDCQTFAGQQVKKALQAWGKKARVLAAKKAEEKNGEDQAMQPDLRKDDGLTELEAEELLYKACENSPLDDEILLGLREAFRRIEQEYKDITELEKAEVIALGGLYVIGTERHESRRIDNQLRGRCARQGDPGETRFFLSLDDAIFQRFGGDYLKGMMKIMPAGSTRPLEGAALTGGLDESQRKVENYFFSMRKNVMEYDEVMETQREIIYDLRRKALLDSDNGIKDVMFEFIDRIMEDLLEGNVDLRKPVEEWNYEKLVRNAGIFCDLLMGHVTEEACQKAAASGGKDGLIAFLQEEGREALDKKYELVESDQDGLAGDLSRACLLCQIDEFWKDHLQNMNFLRTSVMLRQYGQKNPLTEYKLEGYNMFMKIMSKIRRSVAYQLFQVKVEGVAQAIEEASNAALAEEDFLAQA